MTQEEFANALEPFRKELLEEVIIHYQRSERHRGKQAFERWRERVVLFLQNYVPDEAKRFKQSTEQYDMTAGLEGKALYDVFMAQVGKTSLAFVDDLADAARKGRIPNFQENPIPLAGGAESSKSPDLTHPYVNLDRLRELQSISSSSFDVSKLVQFCHELNMCFANECYLAVAMLVRATLDHVPPIFSCKNFAEVANNYGGTKSFKDLMQHLENSSRKIADAHLHTQIRNRETLPNRTQVNYSNEFDVLLGEIVRILK